MNLIKELIKEMRRYDNYSPAIKEKGDIKMDTNKLVENSLKSLHSKINVIYNLLITISKKLDSTAGMTCGSGVYIKNQLPWNLSNKEVYMLSKQYTLKEIEFLSGYDQDKIQKAIDSHLKNNM